MSGGVAPSALLPRRAYRPEQVLAWRQDWGRLSPSLDALSTGSINTVVGHFPEG
jgi:hypothetical protein